MKIFKKSGLIAIALLPMFAHAYDFGSSGSDGANGRGGYDGVNGKNISIRADGTEQSYVLNGTAGSDGTDAQDGSDASSCSHNEPAQNIEGAPGGDGGNGGVGGDGGRGGDTTIVYDTLSQLKFIQITALGNQGGDGGRSGRGGRGCECRPSSWDVKECAQGNSNDCKEVTYQCKDGPDGTFGNTGRGGSFGRKGSVVLIQSPKKVVADKPKLDGVIGDLLASGSSGITVTENIWDHKNGMLGMLASKSDLNDAYVEYNHQESALVKLDWKAAGRTAAEFASVPVSFGLTNSKFHSEFDPSSFLRTHTEENGSNKTLVVDEVLTIDQTLKLSVTHLNAYNRTSSQVVLVIQNAGVQDGPIPFTKVHIKAQHKLLFWWKTIVDSDITPGSLDYSDDNFTHTVKYSLKDTLFPRGQLKVKLSLQYALRGETRTIEIPETLIPIEKAE